MLMRTEKKGEIDLEGPWGWCKGTNYSFITWPQSRE